jgi:hypothetical protein
MASDVAPQERQFLRVRSDGESGLSSMREPATESLLFHLAPMCYTLSVSLAD